MKLKTNIIALTAIMIPAILWAEEIVEVPLESWLGALVEQVGGMKNLGVMAAVLVGVQLVMMGLKTKLGKYAGKYRLLAVYSLTVISSVLALKTGGADWASSLLHGNTLAAFQVLGNQTWKQFMVKKD
jgi:hypothetical protein